MNKLQRTAQTASALLYNAYLYGFLNGYIYQGVLKQIPCPGLNCHSCPGALFACPIGAIQLFASFGRLYVSLYVIGFLSLIGSIGGRIVCGWACPFGLLQDVMHKIPSQKIDIPRFLENTKYIMLFGVVLLLAWYTKEPWFCKAICPAGTLEAGIPLLLLNGNLLELIGPLFYIKVTVLVVMLVLMIAIKRPFCRVLCPLGAIYGLFNRVSIFSMKFDRSRCIMDSKCKNVCPVSHKMYEENDNSSRCIRCLRCRTCPEGAITSGFKRTAAKKGK